MGSLKAYASLNTSKYSIFDLPCTAYSLNQYTNPLIKRLNDLHFTNGHKTADGYKGNSSCVSNDQLYTSTSTSLFHEAFHSFSHIALFYIYNAQSTYMTMHKILGFKFCQNVFAERKCAKPTFHLRKS